MRKVTQNEEVRIQKAEVGTQNAELRRQSADTSSFFVLPSYLLRALTLVELMVVVVILGILATTVTISVRDYLVSGKQNAARQELAQIVAALELFYLESDRYPTNEEGLRVLLERNEAHADGLLRGGDTTNPITTASTMIRAG